MSQTVKHLPSMWETWVWSLGQEDPLEKGMAVHSSILAWRISQTEEPGRLQPMGSQRVRHCSWNLIIVYLISMEILPKLHKPRRELFFLKKLGIHTILHEDNWKILHKDILNWLWWLKSKGRVIYKSCQKATSEQNHNYIAHFSLVIIYGELALW